MNENSRFQALTIKSWLDSAKLELKNHGIQSYNLDSEIMLSEIISKNRTFIHAHPEFKINLINLTRLNKLLKLRLKSYPMAYILGRKEFYGRDFAVNESVLIPKPETEIFIEYINEIAKDKQMSLVDVGTGSGCIGISAKLENPNLRVTLSDISKSALKIARKNAKKLNADVKFASSNLLNSLPRNFDIVVANLPYVDINWQVSTETHHEPKLALYANNSGLELIEKLIDQVSSEYLILESDTRQQDKIIKYANTKSYHLIKKSDFVMLLKSDSYVRTK
jgi:release factor glutamine methyltransferase